MKLFRTASIQRKQTLIILLTAAVALLLACAAFAAYEVITFRKAMLNRLVTLGEIVGDNSAVAMDFNDPKAAEETLSALKKQPNVVGACIYLKNGRLFAVYDRAGDGKTFVSPKFQMSGHSFSRNDLVLFAPIDYKGEVIGTVCLVSDMRELYSRLGQYALIVAAVFLLAMSVALLLSAGLQRLISKPILHLVQTARAVAQDKNYSLRAVKTSEDELGVLVDGFNAMLTRVQENDEALRTAHQDLERRVADRTKELASSVSLLNATLEASADGILVVDRKDCVGIYNTKLVEMWGLPPENLAAGGDERILPLVVSQLKDSEAFLSKVRELYANPGARSHDVLELRDGRIFERDSEPQMLNGECVGRVWSFRDVTERKRAEVELASSVSLLNATLESTADGILVVDLQDNISGFNSKFVEMWGLPREKMVLGQPDRALHISVAQTKDPEAFISKIRELNEHPGAELHDLVELRDGRIFEFDSQPQRLDGECVGRVWSFREITARKRVEAELAETSSLMEALLANSLDHIYFKDRESRFVRCSNTMAAKFGKADARALEGKTDFDFFLEEHARPAFEDEQEIMRTGRPIISKAEKETYADGRVSWALTTKLPWHDKAENIIGTFGISKDITAIKEAEARLGQAHKDLVETSRQAGMAEVATSVLHNVGNVLNSVNISSTLISDKIRKSRVGNMAKAAALILAHKDDLPGFFTRDAKGQQLPDYLSNLAIHLADEQEEILQELSQLNANIEHIKEIVAMQQNYARVSGILESLNLADLIEDALRMNAGALERHQVRVVRELDRTLTVTVEKHKVLQILVNLIRNAKYALDDGAPPEKRMTLRLAAGAGDQVSISVIDNGVGIPAENLTRIFNHGFTTRKAGHGFGLHSGGLAARELGGSLTVQSDGPGQGACFTLEFPREPRNKATA